MEIYAPIEDTMFHRENASGKSEYRRGIPFNPKKCWGKNVRFTPKNIVKNCILSHLVLMFILNISGNQWIVPDMIAKTAPIEST